jgi:hypothetical protein
MFLQTQINLSNFNFHSQEEVHEFTGEVQKISGEVHNDLGGGAHTPLKSGHGRMVMKLAAKINNYLMYLHVSVQFHQIVQIHADTYTNLEYASSLWSPYTIKHKRLVENVQWRATKFILDYPQDLTMPTDSRRSRFSLLSSEEISQTYAYFLNLELEQLLRM